MALEFLAATHPKEHRRPPTDLEKQERVEAGTLRYLLEHGGIATPAQLIEFFGFSHARLTKILTGLEHEGMVRRDMDPTDRRRVIVRLTEEGYAFANGERERMLGFLCALMEILGEEDAAHLLRIARKLQSADVEPPCHHSGKETKQC